MIQRATSAEQLLLPEKGIEAQKIRALLNSYGTQYDFCRFFVQEGCVFAVFGGSAVICGVPDDCDELAEFLCFCGITDIFCSSEVGGVLQSHLQLKAETVHIMRFDGDGSYSDINSEPTLSEVYSIVGRVFDVEFEPWYLDMSHRVRHGVAKCFTYKDLSACVLQHDINGEALISQVATIPEYRGKGFAKSLVLEVCRRCENSDVYVICEDRLTGFYESIGFVAAGECVVFS